LIDGVFRQNLEDTGMDYGKEVEMIRLAHEMDLLTTPYVFNADESTRMAKAGADVVVAHMGLTTGGSIGAQISATLDDCVTRIQSIRDAAFKVNKDIIVLCHGGPIANSNDARYVIEKTRGLHGFFGASSLERLPVEVAIQEAAQGFKAIRLGS
jgi:predicted TIM-barrel enzyme